MPDWQKIVRQHLGDLALDATEKEEVQAELAAHLEETYEALLRERVPDRRQFGALSRWPPIGTICSGKFTRYGLERTP